MKKGSDTTEEGSKTSLISNKNSSNEDEDEDEEEVLMVDDNNNIMKPKKNGGGGISSPRHYIRSKTPRLRWTPDLHLCFLHAIERLGGEDRATPKLVLQMMNIKGLSIAHVKSHLQMHRSRKIDDPNQVMPDQGLLIHGEDQCIYNLSQLPILQSFNQRPTTNTTLRYGGASWSRHGLYHHGSFTERVFGINNYGKSCINSRFDHLGANSSSSFNLKTTQQTRPPKLATTHKLAERRKEQQVSYSSNNIIFSPEKLWPWTMTREGRSTMKRKKTWERGINLELSLSSLRGLTSRNDDHVDKFSNIEDGKGDDEVDNNSLSLSLFPTSPSKLSRLKEVHISGKSAKLACTLDLTL